MGKNLLYLLMIIFLLVSCKQKQQTVKEYKPPEFKGIAFVQVKDGNHISVLNLENGDIGRIVLNKKISAISLVPEMNKLYVFSKDGFLKILDLSSAKRGEWKRVASSLCDADTTDGRTIYLINPEEKALLLYSTEKNRIIKKTSISSDGCSISVVESEKEILLINNRNSSIAILDKETLSIKNRIPHAGNSIHHAKFSPDKKELWVAEGNEYKDGRPYGVGFAKAEAMPGGLNIVDVATGALKDFIMIGGNVADVNFSSDGRYVFALSSQMPEYDDATLSIVNLKKERVIKQYALCKVCHFRSGITLDKAFVSSFQVNEKMPIPSITGLLESGFQSTEPGGESIIIRQIYETAE